MALHSKDYNPYNNSYHDRIVNSGKTWCKIIEYWPVCEWPGSGSNKHFPSINQVMFPFFFRWRFLEDPLPVYKRPQYVSIITRWSLFFLPNRQTVRVLYLGKLTSTCNPPLISCYAWGNFFHFLDPKFAHLFVVQDVRFICTDLKFAFFSKDVKRSLKAFSALNCQQIHEERWSSVVFVR